MNERNLNSLKEVRGIQAKERQKWDEKKNKNRIYLNSAVTGRYGERAST